LSGAFLSKTQLLAGPTSAPPLESLKIEEFGGDICLRSLSHRELQAAREKNADDHEGLMSELAALTICDENGVSFFNNTEATELLASVSMKTQGRIVDAILRINGLRVDEEEVGN